MNEAKVKKARHDLLNELAVLSGAMELKMYEMALKAIERMRVCLDDAEKELRTVVPIKK